MGVYDGNPKRYPEQGKVIAKSVNVSREIAPPNPKAGDLWFDRPNGNLNFRYSTVTRALATEVYVDGKYPKNYISGALPVYASTSTFTVASFSVRNSGDNGNIEKATSTTVNIASSGLNGLDTGAEAGNTWYYLYAITDGSTPGLILSATNEAVSGSITLPGGYTRKRQLPFAVRNDGSSNFIQFWCEGTLRDLTCFYDVHHAAHGEAVGTTNVLDGGASGSFADVNCAAYVPAISTSAILKVGFSHSTTGLGYVRKKGSSHNGTQLRVAGSAQIAEAVFSMATDSSQVAQYQVSAGSMDISVYGWRATAIV